MLVSVLIPTHHRPARLAALLRALAGQTLARDAYEVLVGFDGPDSEAAKVGLTAWREAGGGEIKAIECPRCGQAAVRNRLLEVARGETLVFLNDDMVPDAGFLAAHARAQAAAREGRRTGAIVVGASPWVRHADDRLFDRMVRETSMVFFHDRMDAPAARADRERDWGFRHAWMLNLSMPRDLVREVGGVTVFPSTYGYEDDELAFRMQRAFGVPVLYRPEATALHDHRLTARAYLEREYKLGYAALGFAKTTPECAAALFGRDVASSEEAVYTRQFVKRERGGASRAVAPFLETESLPASTVDGPHAAELLALAYGQHLPLKRWVWRSGLLGAIEGESMDAAGMVASVLG